MNNTKLDVTYRDQVHHLEAGITVEEFLKNIDGDISDRVLAALVNRRQVMLDFPLRGRVELDLVCFGDREGESVYKRSVSLIFYEACLELFPDIKVVIGQSLGNSYHYQIDGEVEDLDEMARKVEKRMEEIRDEHRPLTRQTVTIEEVESYFRERGFEDKLRLINTRRSSTVSTISCGGVFVDIAHGPYAPHTGCLTTFGVLPYEGGVLLRFPRRRNRDELPPFWEKPLLFKTYQEASNWQEVLGIHHVGQLNGLCLDGGIREIVRVAEGLHEKKIAQIADEIMSHGHRIKLVTVAGPSSSGKTTFVQRLGIQLRVNGITPVSLSLDNYYVNREFTPLDEDGNLDFEALDAIDLALFREHLKDLLDGKLVHTPVFDFVTGMRKSEKSWNAMQLEENQILVIEGIHGLNEKLTNTVPREHKYRIFISALSQLSIDDHNRIFTSDGRLIRRIVRDNLFRGFNAERTLGLWERVRRGEGRWIFPFQEQADVMFNSALPYEQAVLKTYAERFLLQVPKTSSAYPEAFRLLKFLSMFVPIFPDEVPYTSILREFIGGSIFEY